MPTPMEGFPLSLRQKRLWLLGGEGPAFKCRSTVRIEGPLEAERCRAALLRITGRHEILRTTYHRRPGLRLPLQVVASRPEISWRESSELPETAFDLAQGPILDVVWSRSTAGEVTLGLSLPSLAADSSTMCNLVTELAAELAGAEIEEEPVQYGEFAQWQAQLTEEDGADEGIDFWRPGGAGGASVAAATSLRLRGESADRDSEPSRTERVELAKDSAVVVRLEAFSRSLGVSPVTCLRALWHLFLGRLAEDREIAVAEAMSGRPYEELDSSFGLFSQAVPVASRYAPQGRFEELVAELETAHDTAAQWQEYLLPAGEGGPAAVEPWRAGFEVVALPDRLQVGDLTFHVESLTCLTEPLTLGLRGSYRPGGLRLEMVYDAVVHTPSEARKLSRAFETMAADVFDRSHSPACRLRLLVAEARRSPIPGADRSEVEPARWRSLPELFEAQVDRTPQRSAVEIDGRGLDYLELDRRANQRARRLRESGVGPEALVAVCVMDPLEMVVALLGVLKAGGAYLPLDPTHPRERLELMLEDSGARHLMTEKGLVATLPTDGLEVIRVDAEQGVDADRPCFNLEPDNLAYVLYTSGSTGRPKGVQITHRGLANYLTWCLRAYSADEGTGALVHSPIGFDLTVTGLYAPLLTGGRVLFVDMDQAVEGLVTELERREDLSLIKLTPAHLDLLARRLDPESVAGRTRALVIGGEALHEKHLAFWRRHAPETRLFNEYGPTETVVGCAVFEIPAERTFPSGVPIGRPIARTRIHLVDEYLEPVLKGFPGEIAVAGDGLARGYRRLAALTAERFVPDPSSPDPGSRLYRTGDLARWTSEGELLYLGRGDHQVKVRGVRIELEEVRSVIACHSDIAECAVTLRSDDGAEPCLAAYVVPRLAASPSVGELLAFVRRRLPEAMVPATFTFLEELPLTPNGKVDRAALPEPEKVRPDLEVDYVAPQSRVERQIVEVWGELLGIEKIGVHDNFFDLGGYSYLMFEGHRRLTGIFEREIPMVRLFQHPTVSALAQFLSAEETVASFAANEDRAQSRKQSMSRQRGRRQRRMKDEVPGSESI